MIIVCAYLIIAFSATYDTYEVSFYFALISSVLHGVSSSLGGCTLLGFFKGFPSEVVGYYGSGTGFAGIFGSGGLLLLKGAKFSDGLIFFLMLPTVVPYFLSFYWLNK